MRLLVLICCAVGVGLVLCLAMPPQGGRALSFEVTKSRLSDGNTSRLQAAMQKARRGEPITVGFIGGSITKGERATELDRQYSQLVTRWWAEHFPLSQVTCLNAGVAGTGSTYGCLRASRDLLSAHPDVVVVEFGVNDRDDLPHAQTYEGVVRQIIEAANHPAVILLFMMHHDGTNAQDFESAIGQQYQLPMISFRDAVWPVISAGQLRWSDLFADVIHPNDRGHAFVAECIESLLDDCESDSRIRAAVDSPAPPPCFTDCFARTKLVDGADLQPVKQHGWEYDSQLRCWKSCVPGSVIEFEISGQAVDLLYGRRVMDAGTVSVNVDDGSPVLCDGWFDATWAGYCQADVVGRELSPGMHRVRVELLQQRNALSNGYEFEILGLGAAGIGSK